MAEPEPEPTVDEGQTPFLSATSRRTVLLFAAAAALGMGAVAGPRSSAFAATPSNLEFPSWPESGPPTRARAATASTTPEGYSNGNLPDSALVYVGESTDRLGSQYLAVGAAASYQALNQDFSGAFGKVLTMAEGYRDLERQEYLWDGWVNRKPGFNQAAPPGTSIHGLGRAVDFSAGVNVGTSAEKAWMNANAPGFGWHPTGDGFQVYEPWHFEYDDSWTPAEPEPTPEPEQVGTDMKLIEHGGDYWLIGEFTSQEINQAFVSELNSRFSFNTTLGGLVSALKAQYGDAVSIRDAVNVTALQRVADYNRLELIYRIQGK